MKKLRLALCFALLGLAPAQSQTFTMPPPAGVSLGACVYNLSPPTLTTATPGMVQCDSSGNLRISGTVTTSLAGTTSNASSAVATSATNVPTVSYNYGFNGTTWDQLQVDASKNLKTVDTNILADQAPVAPAAATATKSILTGCQATSAAINPTTGQQAAVDCDLNNNLLVSSGGAPNLAIAQVSVATSDTAVVAARALRRSVTIQQITGTQNVFCNQTTASAVNGVVLPAVVGASFTFNTTSAIRCIAITGAQTVAIAETF